MWIGKVSRILAINHGHHFPVVIFTGLLIGFTPFAKIVIKLWIVFTLTFLMKMRILYTGGKGDDIKQINGRISMIRT